MQRQEHQESGIEEAFIIHKLSCTHYIVNLHALHNTHLVQQFLPCSLSALLPWIGECDCRAKHDQLAARLRVKMGEQKAKNNENRRKQAAENLRIQGGTSAVTMAKRQQV
jgi:hypothetical protein